MRSKSSRSITNSTLALEAGAARDLQELPEVRRQLGVIEVGRQLGPRRDVAELGDDRGAARREPARDPRDELERAGLQVERLRRVVEVDAEVGGERGPRRARAACRGRRCRCRRRRGRCRRATAGAPAGRRPSRSTGSDRTRRRAASTASTSPAIHVAASPIRSRCAAASAGDSSTIVYSTCGPRRAAARSRRARRSRGRRRSRARGRGPRGPRRLRDQHVDERLAVGAAARAPGAARAGGATAWSPGDRTARRRRRSSCWW